MRFRFSWLAVGVCLVVHPNVNLDLAQAANILAIFPFHYGSSFLVVRPLIKTLLERGHNVTFITPEGMPHDIEGVRHIRIHKLNKRMLEMIESDEMFRFLVNKWMESTLAATMFFNMCQDILSDDGVQRMLKDEREHFDLILMDASNLDALYGLVEYYNATLIGLTSISVNWYTEELAGNPAPSIYEPISQIGYSRDHSILSRIFNWMHIIEEKLLEQLLVLPAQLQVFKKFFGYSEQKFYELRNRFSVILVNNHFSVGRVRSNVPNLIEVGGLHLSEPPEPCDEELQKFMEEAQNGVIYFSMGQDIMVKFLPENLQQTLVKSFAKLEQRIVWKNEFFSMPNVSENIYVIEKAPQRHILAHPKMKLFITNGGLLSVMEAVDSGVPMLGLPIFFDQFGNLRWGQSAGMAEVLDINKLREENLTNTIRELIDNPKYTMRAKKMSDIFKDRPMSPLDTAVWWMEYALRNRDISHIRLNAEEIPLFVYYRIDGILTFFLRFGMVAASLIFLGLIFLRTCVPADLINRMYLNFSIK
ncbi:UDP-glucosyltransferase 2-like [Drosophila biarmipes]|uniref:UDP-glucosyltransferase 2-like n=1 Tax=Drosophila biarmipes TaxID=125945 RepID=UPI0007E62D24|nr:UDP-glucosyltransferase 2-like [Drosophila biarmipes]